MRCKQKIPEDVKAVARRGRGRGRGTTRVIKQNIEPECLTISSVEEDDNRKQKRVAEIKKPINPQSMINSEEAYTILDKEPIITYSTVAVNQTTSNSSNSSAKTEKSTSTAKRTSNLSTHLTCRTVRIGSYKYIPNNDIQICSSGLKLEVPCLADDKSFITVDIKYTDLVKVLIHFSQSMPVLFFYTNVATGLRIRDLLGMQDPKGPYFDPAGKDHTLKEIALLPEKISEESKNALKELYKNIFDVLQ